MTLDPYRPFVSLDAIVAASFWNRKPICEICKCEVESFAIVATKEEPRFGWQGGAPIWTSKTLAEVVCHGQTLRAEI